MQDYLPALAQSGPSAILTKVYHRLGKLLSYPIELLILANALAFLFCSRSFGGPIELTHLQIIELGGDIPVLALRGEPWRLFVALFLHMSAAHLVGNMIALLWYGKALLKEVSPATFWCIYFIAGLAGNVLFLWTNSLGDVCAGASGCVFGLAGALLGYELLGKPVLNKMFALGKFGLFGAALFVLFTVDSLGLHAEHVSVSAHLGGAATGMILAWATHFFLSGERKNAILDLYLASFLLLVFLTALHPIARMHAPKEETKSAILFSVYSSGIAVEVYDLKKKHDRLLRQLKTKNLSSEKAGAYLQEHLQPALQAAQKRLDRLAPEGSADFYRQFHLSEMIKNLRGEIETSTRFADTGNEDFLDKRKEYNLAFERNLASFNGYELIPIPLEPVEDAFSRENEDSRQEQSEADTENRSSAA